ncbi:MAG: hypothetical protein KIT80_23340 [Chitinophagaceae bacterium]|nr:hypothetical protein [Nitrosomonas sp.]MCW5929874.1 hypothetical protein [Chitinophagaceae bacterium]
MATPILLLDTVVRMQSALGDAKTITAISKASEAVITATHDFSVGDYILLDGIGGMTELNKRIVRVKAVSTTVSFTAEGLDSTNWTTYTSSGTATKITSFVTFDNVTSFNYAEPQPNRIDVTTIHQNQKTEVFGLDDAPTATMAMNADPLGAAIVELRKASLAKSTRGFVVTTQTGQILIFNAYVAGGRGFDGSVGAVATGQASMTFVSPEQWFAS